MGPIRLAVVDPQQLVLDLLEKQLANESSLKVIACESSGSSAVRQLLDQEVDVILTENDLWDMTAFEMFFTLQEHNLQVSVVLLTDFFSRLLLHHSLQLGFKGYLMKRDSYPTLLENIHRLAWNNSVYSSSVLAHLEYDPHSQRYSLSGTVPSLQMLTKQQCKIFPYLVRGWKVRDIAQELEMTVSAVESLKHRILKRFRLKNREELTSVAIQEGFVSMNGISRISQDSLFLD